MRRAAFTLIAAIVLVVLPLTAVNAATPAANKTAVAASGLIELNGTTDLFNPPVEVTLLSETVKTPGNSSLLISFTTECFIGSYDLDSDIPYGGFILDGRLAAVRVWVEIDGEPLPTVNFCTHGLFQLEFSEQPNLLLSVELELFGGAYGFNWPALGLSNGNHLVEVKALLIANVLSLDSIPDEGTIAVVGKRTLIVDPIKVRNGETIGNDSP